MSYTLAYTGAEIDALLGKIDAIFVAEYGSTIYSEVTAAIAAGNKVIVANAGKVFVYAGTDDNSGYVFTQSGPNAAKPNATYVTLSTGNVWSTNSVDLATLQQFYASLMEDTASGSIASFPDGAEGVPVKELAADIEPIQSGSGDPSPDNIRPISGYTGAEIPVDNNNLIDDAKLYMSGKRITIGATTDKGVAGHFKAGEYVLSVGLSSLASTNLYVAKVIGGVVQEDLAYAYAITSLPFTLDEDADLTFWSFNNSFSSLADISKAWLNIGSTATAYEPYNGTVYSVSWSDHGTIYKGTAQYKGGGEWEITKTHEGVDMGTLSWEKQTTVTGKYRFRILPLPNASAPTSSAEIADIQCSMFKAVAANDTWNGSEIGVSLNLSSGNAQLAVYAADLYADAAAFTTAVTGQTLLYPLATPTTFTVSGPDPETLLGDNNMWSNTGDISLKYRANTALYIEKKLGE